MKNLYEICVEIEQMDFKTKKQELESLQKEVIEFLKDKYSYNYDEASKKVGTFLLASATVDGRLEKSEFELIEPTIQAFFGLESYDEVKLRVVNFFKGKGNYKQKLDDDIDYFGSDYPLLKEKIIRMCLLVCGADSAITKAELEWIRLLDKQEI